MMTVSGVLSVTPFWQLNSHLAFCKVLFCLFFFGQGLTLKPKLAYNSCFRHVPSR